MFDFGIVDALHIGDAVRSMYIVQFTCGCTVVVGGERILLWAGRVAAVCEHGRSTLGQHFR